MFEGDVKGSKFTAKLTEKTPRYPYVVSKSSNKISRTYERNRRENPSSAISVLRLNHARRKTRCVNQTGTLASF